LRTVYLLVIIITKTESIRRTYIEIIKFFHNNFSSWEFSTYRYLYSIYIIYIILVSAKCLDFSSYKWEIIVHSGLSSNTALSDCTHKQTSNRLLKIKKNFRYNSLSCFSFRYFYKNEHISVCILNYTRRIAKRNKIHFTKSKSYLQSFRS